MLIGHGGRLDDHAFTLLGRTHRGALSADNIDFVGLFHASRAAPTGLPTFVRPETPQITLRGPTPTGSAARFAFNDVMVVRRLPRYGSTRATKFFGEMAPSIFGRDK
jgi:hypothetical protein